MSTRIFHPSDLKTFVINKYIVNSVNLKNIRNLKCPSGPVKWSAVVISLHTDRLADEEDMVKSIVSRMS